MSSPSYDELEDERYDRQQEYAQAARYERLLMRNPDCRDPDHPGCEICNPQEDQE